MKITLEYCLTNPLSVIINQDGSIGKITNLFQPNDSTHELPFEVAKHGASHRIPHDIKMKEAIRFILIGVLLLAFVGSSTAQVTYQLGLGLLYQDTTPEQQINISNDEYAIFGRGYTTISASIMASYKVKDRLTIRTGLDFRGTPFHSELRFAYTDDDGLFYPAVLYDYTILDVHAPMDIQFWPTEGFYLYTGISTNFKFDLTHPRTYEGTQAAFSISIEETAKFRELIADQVRRVGINYRAGMGFRYKFIGLEMSFDHTLINALKPAFEYGSDSYKTRLRYGSFQLRLLIYMKSKGGLKDFDKRT